MGFVSPQPPSTPPTNHPTRFSPSRFLQNARPPMLAENHLFLSHLPHSSVAMPDVATPSQALCPQSVSMQCTYIPRSCMFLRGSQVGPIIRITGKHGILDPINILVSQMGLPESSSGRVYRPSNIQIADNFCLSLSLQNGHVSTQVEAFIGAFRV